MSELGRAFKYCFRTLAELSRHPGVLKALLFFILESLLASALFLGIIALFLTFWGMGFWSQITMGAFFGLLLVTLYFLMNLLAARVVRATTPEGVETEGKSHLAGAVWAYTLSQLWLPGKVRPSAKAEAPAWLEGTHLLLPLIGRRGLGLQQAVEALQTLKWTRPLSFDPRQISVRGLTNFFIILMTIFGIAAGSLAAAFLTTGVVIQPEACIQATAFALLIGLVLVLPCYALAGIKRGFYGRDVLDFETQAEPRAFTGLLSQVMVEELEHGTA